MNNSWLKTSQSSPGFLYFNTNKTPNTSNTSSPEFIGFSDIPSPGRNNFSPQNYSSPQNFGKRFNTGQQPPQKKWRKNNYSDKPYQNRSFNTNNSFNSSFNNSSSRNSSFGNKSKERNISMYMHSSFTENPWEKLERQMKEEVDTTTPTNSSLDVKSGDM